MEFEKLGAFYLGREYDFDRGELLERPLMYDARDLTTHAVCVGMTGSGKTGLCIDLLEEAAIDRVPAVIIDPKGDIANLLLAFPNLTPEEFRPWINADDARREGLTDEQYSRRQADLWYVPPEDRVLLVLVDVRDDSPTSGNVVRMVLGDGRSRLVRVPPGVAHGCRNLGTAMARIIYFTDLQFSADPEETDEGRLPWDFVGPDVWEPTRD